MPIGETVWTVKEIAAATGTCPTAGTRTLQRLERRLRLLLRATLALEPDLRPCDLAEILEAVIRTGGALAEMDAPRLRQRLQQLASEEHAAKAG